ncbi:MAG: hypothetical protein N2Z70_07825 [Bdellovibrionaceae bacterium]|jgi:hypothetical protein|nr:hypothetical protein [Pseudobdellovibrionaceae bacterium]
MNKWGIYTLIMGSMLACWSFHVLAAEGSSSEGAAQKKQGLLSSQSSLKTSHSFEDYLVQGQFHFADQTVITVEEDKALEGLVQIPKSFNERMKDYE